MHAAFITSGGLVRKLTWQHICCLHTHGPVQLPPPSDTHHAQTFMQHHFAVSHLILHPRLTPVHPPCQHPSHNPPPPTHTQGATLVAGIMRTAVETLEGFSPFHPPHA
jgi:hypothetical protein